MEFGRRLRKARMRRGLTQQALADAVGQTLRNYQTYEQGVRRPKFETLVSIADALHVTTDWLLCRTDEDPFG